MTYRSRCLLCAGLFAAETLLFASPSAATPVAYAPSSTLQPLVINTTTFTLAQINDGEKSPTLPKGFATKAKTGDILFTFNSPTDLTQFTLWNNVVVDSIGGVTAYKLEFLDSSDNVIGQSSYTAVPNQVAPQPVALTLNGVSKVRLHVDSSSTRIEIREVEFEGQRSKPASYTVSCNEIRGMGFPVSATTITRSSGAMDRGAVVVPSAYYSLGPLRGYNNGQADRIFVDSFPLIPDAKKQHVCELRLKVRGTSGNVGNNDSLNVFLPRSAGQIVGALGWVTAVGTPLPGKKLTNNMTPSPWIYDLTINSSFAMHQALADALAGPVNSLDVVVQDDSLVKDITAVYAVY
jgi:hypothetical protein